MSFYPSNCAVDMFIFEDNVPAVHFSTMQNVRTFCLHKRTFAIINTALVLKWMDL